MEGNFYHPEITTGVQAYNYGMKKLNEALGPDLRRGNFFISLSIAPKFPSQYAHSRRISCDVFGNISGATGSVEMMLNCLTYGWWTNRYVYQYNDPDYMVLYRAYNQNTQTLQLEDALVGYIAAAITGGLMFNSDLFTSGVNVGSYTSNSAHVTAALARVKAVLENYPDVNEMASASRTFRPLDSVTGGSNYSAAQTFVRDDREFDGSYYIAYFHLSRTGSTSFPAIPLERLGLNPSTTYTVYDVINGNEAGTVTGSMGARTLSAMTNPTRPPIPVLLQLRPFVSY